MKPILKNILFALLVACCSSAASAMSLGEGQILSRVGELFSANISFIGAYDKEVRFHQVRATECRSSMIGKTTAGCDYLYEGSLTFFIKKTPDGQYFLRVAGEKSEDLFYRIIIRYESASGGLVYKAFEFLPEFRSNADTPPVAQNDSDTTVNTSLPSGKYGVIMGKIVEVPADEEIKRGHASAKSPAEHNTPINANVSNETKPAVQARQKRSAAPAQQLSQLKPQAAKPAEPKLQIKKEGAHADDIYALQKENEAIEQQINLLEKQIALLKEVATLKGQTGASAVPATSIAPASQATITPPTPAPIKVAVPATQQPNSDISLLNWILIAIVVVLSASLWFLYRRQKSYPFSDSLADFRSTRVSPSPDDDKQSLDLTGRYFR
jgi:hypothetical protein